MCSFLSCRCEITMLSGFCIEVMLSFCSILCPIENADFGFWMGNQSNEKTKCKSLEHDQHS
jgi:hypothetical protein